MNRPTLVMFALTGLGGLGLAACGSSSPSAASSPPETSAPAVAAPFTAAGFSTVLPVGWTDETHNSADVNAAAAPGSGTTLALFNQPNPGAVVGHIGVTTVPTQLADSDIPAYLASAANHGATNVSPPTPFTLGNATGQYVTYDSSQSGGIVAKNQDMVINQGATTYKIIYADPSSSYDSLKPALDSVLSAWKWSA